MPGSQGPIGLQMLVISGLSRREYLKWAKPVKLLEPRLGATCHFDVATDGTDIKDIPLVDVVVVASCSPDAYGSSALQQMQY